MATNLIALDVGEQRVGVALVRAEVRIATVLPTLERPAADFWQQLEAILQEYAVETVVVGLPRGLEGQETAQTKTIETFGDELTQRFSVTIAWQDEALTSREAEHLLKESGKPYAKGDIDAQAARLILEDYLSEHPEPANPEVVA
jgi:putative Holliday junction resolvase